MILFFLRLFAEFTSLELLLRETASARAFADERTRLWQVRCESAESLRDQALSEKERNHKMMANWMALYYGSPSVPYPEVFVAPLREEPEPEQAPRKRHATDLMRELDHEFREAFGQQAEREFDQFNQS